MERTRSRQIKTLALTALFAAFAAALGYLDAILPVFDFIPIPGLKLGLANFATLIALYVLGTQYAAAVSVIRILLVNLLLFPSFTSLVFSACGGVLSFAVMLILKKNDFHVISVSVAGAVAHNFAQLLIAAIMLQTPRILTYFTVLLPISMVTGALLGLLTVLTLPRFRYAAGKEPAAGDEKTLDKTKDL